ncbi:MAG: hypothetical protein ABL871_09020 [Terricaulis sp.]
MTRRVIIATLALLALSTNVAGQPLSDEELAAQTAVAADELDRLVFLSQPGREDYARNFPQGIFGMDVAGRVVLDCLVGAGGDLDCAVQSEQPRHFGFGDAALRLSGYFRVAPQTIGGQATAGGRIRVPVHFEPAPSEF